MKKKTGYGKTPISWSFYEKFGFQYPCVALVAWTNFSSRTVGTPRKSSLSLPSFSFFSPHDLNFFSIFVFPHFLFFFFIFSFLFFFLFNFFLLFGFHSIELFFLFSYFVGLIPSERKLPLTFLPSLSWPCVFTWSMYHVSCVTWTHALGVTFHTTWLSCHVSFSHGAMYHPTPDVSTNMKFRPSRNSTKFNWVTRFPETNSTMKSVSSSEI